LQNSLNIGGPAFTVEFLRPTI